MPHPTIPAFQCCTPQLYKDTAGIHIADDQINLDGGVSLAQTSVAISYNPAIDDYIVGVDSTTGAIAIVLRSLLVCSGRTYVIKDEGGQALANNITISTEGAETIDGAATAVIGAAYGVVRLYCDGTNWFTI